MKNTLSKSASVIAGNMSHLEKVIGLSRMGSSFQTRFSFMPSITRRILKSCTEGA